jgi:hypothetical protein
MSFTYFDLSTGKYKTITSPEILINVLDGPSTGDNAEVAANSGVAKMKVSAGEQFQFIKLKTSLTAINQKDFLGSTLFYVLTFLPLLIIPIIVLVKKKKEAIDGDVAGNKMRLSNKLAKKYLSEAKQQLQNKEMFYVALEKALAGLNEEQRKCVELFYIQDKSYNEIVEITGYSLNNVKSFIQNGKRNLRIILEKKIREHVN